MTRSRARTDEAADDPIRLLRHPGPIAPYPAEPSNEDLAAAVGVSPDEIVRMDMNTLGGGPLPAVAAATAMPGGDALEYGDLAYARLRSALSALTGVPPKQIIPGAGADELIRLVTMLTAGPGAPVVVPVPTFPMFAVEARLAGAEVVEVPRERADLRQPVERIRAVGEAAGARLVWLCTPNNPTGDAYSLDEVRRLVAGLPALVVVDEVYVEFAEASSGAPSGSLSAAALIDDHPNLLVLRSLSKAYGLAGARVGYLVAGPALAQRLDASRLPLAIGAPSEALALAAVGDPAGARRRHEELVAERGRIATTLSGFGWELLPSVTNFLTFRPPNGPALARALHRRGLIVRLYDSGLLAGWLRVTVRSAAENDRFLAALADLS
ncbi:MAG: pyridoxal phosphate-dependent aminotransferase [Candidatus Limnocylindria bacterium]